MPLKKLLRINSTDEELNRFKTKARKFNQDFSRMILLFIFGLLTGKTKFWFLRLWNHRMHKEKQVGKGPADRCPALETCLHIGIAGKVANNNETTFL